LKKLIQCGCYNWQNWLEKTYGLVSMLLIRVF